MPASATTAVAIRPARRTVRLLVRRTGRVYGSGDHPYGRQFRASFTSWMAWAPLASARLAAALASCAWFSATPAAA